jgi:hypothetical protein
VVERRRLRRLKALAQKGGVVVQLRNGKTEVFSKHAPLYLWALEVEEGMEAEEGNFVSSEPTSTQGREALALREALEHATPQSRTEYEERFGGMFVWEENSAW